MTRSRFQPLVWPVALLAAAGVTALLAEATAWSAATASLYGMIRVVSDLVLVIGMIWLGLGIIRVLRATKR